jgi:hypothetical protein
MGFAGSKRPRTRCVSSARSFRSDAQHRTMVRNYAPENLEISDVQLHIVDRRFAPSGMTHDHSPAAPTAPGFCINRVPQKNRGRRECRVRAAPIASCAKVESTRVSRHTYAASRRHSPRNGFNGFLRALPGDRALLSPSPARRGTRLRRLDASVGASEPHDFAVRFNALRLARHSVHRIPYPTFVTIAKRPSFRVRDTFALLLLLPIGEAKNFYGHDWTRKSQASLSGKSIRIQLPDIRTFIICKRWRSTDVVAAADEMSAFGLRPIRRVV